MFNTYLGTIKTDSTRETYGRGLAYFQKWAADTGVEVGALRVRDVLAFRAHLEDALAGSSANVYLSALRSCLRWAAQAELVEPGVYQATTVVQNAKTVSHLPQVLKDEQVEDLMCLPDVGTVAGARDLAFICLLVSSGMRVSEAVNLDFHSLDIQGRTARVIGKGSKERKVFFNERAADAIVHYLRLRGAGEAHSPVFINHWGSRISVRFMQERVASYGIGLEGGGRLHPHTLRHTFATQFLDRTGDLDATRRHLGHARAETTQVYTQTATGRLEAQYRSVMDEETLPTKAGSPVRRPRPVFVE